MPRGAWHRNRAGRPNGGGCAGGAEVGAHKTSMLQDLERGRPLEIEALLGAVVEMSEWVGVDMPIGRSVLAPVRQRAAMR